MNQQVHLAHQVDPTETTPGHKLLYCAQFGIFDDPGEGRKIVVVQALMAPPHPLWFLTPCLQAKRAYLDLGQVAAYFLMDASAEPPPYRVCYVEWGYETSRNLGSPRLHPTAQRVLAAMIHGD